MASYNSEVNSNKTHKTSHCPVLLTYTLLRQDWPGVIQDRELGWAIGNHANLRDPIDPADLPGLLTNSMHHECGFSVLESHRVAAYCVSPYGS